MIKFLTILSILTLTSGCMTSNKMAIQEAANIIKMEMRNLDDAKKIMEELAEYWLELQDECDDSSNK